jgi:hypothetical protein
MFSTECANRRCNLHAGKKVPSRAAHAAAQVMYEHRKHKLLTRRRFAIRVLRHLALAVGFTVISLAIGIAGYYYLADLDFVDALLNASMILGGMGPVATLHSTNAKLFASFYALFSGLVVIGVAGIVVAPFAHRMLHSLHAVDD